MDVIALRGPSDSGKTHALNAVYQFLLDMGYTQVKGRFVHPEVFNFIGEKVYATNDFSDILTNNNQMIGISSGVKSDLSETLKSFEKAGCKKIICACNDTPENTKIIEKFAKHFFIDKIAEEDDSLKRIKDYSVVKKILNLL